MRAIRCKDTKPELLVRKALHARGFRYRVHVRSLPGSPDLVFPKYQSVIFIHGCFWHRHDCSYFKMPKTRTEFWSSKIAANIRRDESAICALHSLGWRVLVVWECALRKKDDALTAHVDEIEKWICGGLSAKDAAYDR